MKAPRRLSWQLWALPLWVILLRLPFIGDVSTLTPDGAEYLALARGLRTEGAYRTDLKWQFFTDDPVVHSGWRDRPPLYPLVAAGGGRVLAGVDPVLAARAVNVLIAGIASLLCLVLLAELFCGRTAFWAVGLTFSLPHSINWTSQPVTESLSLALTFATLLAWLGAGRGRNGVIPAAGAGLLAGLLYLTRPTGVLLFLACLIDALWRRRSIAMAVGLTAGFFFAAAPWHAWLWVQYGDPLASSLAFTLAVASVDEVTRRGFEREIPSPAAFLGAHWQTLPGLLGRQVYQHAQAILLPFVALAPAAAGLRLRDLGGERAAWGWLGLLLVLTHSLAWSAVGSSRYFLPLFPLLMAILIEKAMGEPSTGRRAGRACVLLTAVGYALAVAHFAVERRNPPEAAVTYRRAAAEAGPADTLATDQPWMLNVLTHRPCVMLPRADDGGAVRRYIRRFDPTVVLLFARDPDARRTAELWKSAGWEFIDRGDYLLGRPPIGAP